MFETGICLSSPKMFVPFRKFFLSLLIAVVSLNFILPPQYIYAQSIEPSILGLPAPGAMIGPSPAYEPPLIKGMTVHPENPLLFDFIIEPGDSNARGQALNQEALKMVGYFLASITIPDDQMWVNLSPYEKDRIVSDKLGQTAMGRDLLAQDYVLKQMTASLLYPDNELGRKFWDKIYKTAYEKFKTTQIPVETFNKVWIVPKRAAVYEDGESVFVVSRELKVMLESDYQAMGAHQKSVGAQNSVPVQDNAESLELSEQIIREIIIPELEREVNEGKYFAELRQIYNAMILAKWYKENLRQTLLGQVYTDQNKIKGVDVADKNIREKIYQRYLKAFEKGVYNFIKEERDIVTDTMIPRKYFSGGMQGLAGMSLEVNSSPVTLGAEQKAQLPQRGAVRFTVALTDIGNGASSPVINQDQAPAKKIFGGMTFVGKDAQWLMGKFQDMDYSILDLSEEVTAVALSGGPLRGKGGLGHLNGDENADSDKMKRSANGMITNAYNYTKNPKTGNWDKINLNEVENLRPLMVLDGGMEKQLEFTVSFNGNYNTVHNPIGRDYRVKVYYANNDGNLLIVQSAQTEEFYHHLYDDFDHDKNRWIQFGFQARRSVEFMKKVGVPDVLYLNEGHMAFVYPAIRNDIEWHRQRGLKSKFEGIKIIFKNHTPEWAGIPKKGANEIDELRNLVGSDLIQPYMLTGGHYNSLEAMVQNAIFSDPKETGVTLIVTGVSKEHEEVILAVLLKRFSKEDAKKILTHIQNGSRAIDWMSDRVKAAIDQYGVDGVTGEMLLEIAEQDKLDTNVDVYELYRKITRESIEAISLNYDEVVEKLKKIRFYNERGLVNQHFDFAVFDTDQAWKEKVGDERFGKLRNFMQEDVSIPQFDEELLKARPILGFLRRWVEYKEAGVLLSLITWITGDKAKTYRHPVIPDLSIFEDPARVDELEALLANPQWTEGAGLEFLIAAGGEAQGEAKGRGWLDAFKGYSKSPELKGRLVVIEDAGMPIMKWITKVTTFGYNVPDPTREASGTSQQRWGFLGRLIIAINRAGMSAQIKHREGGWLVKPFPKKTQAELMRDFDPEEEGGQRIRRSREELRRRVPVLVAAYLTEAADLYYNNRAELARRMLKSFRTTMDTVDTDRMVLEKEALAVSALNTDSAQDAIALFEKMRKAMYEQNLFEHFYRWNPGLRNIGIGLTRLKAGIAEVWTPLDDIILEEERRNEILEMPEADLEKFLGDNGLVKDEKGLWRPAAEEFESAYLDMTLEKTGSSPVAVIQSEGTQNVGGIDLNPALFDLQIKRGRDGVPLPLALQPVATMRIDGFLPVIINVAPVTDLPVFAN